MGLKDTLKNIVRAESPKEQELKERVEESHIEIKVSFFTYCLILRRLELALEQKRADLHFMINNPQWLQTEINELENAINEIKGAYNGHNV